MVENIKIPSFQEIFVKSRGEDFNHDYTWAFINQKFELSNIDESKIIYIKKLFCYIQTEEPFLILSKQDNNFILCIGDLDSKRKDIVNRIIRNTIVIAFNENEDTERLCRLISIEFLKNFDSLKNKIDSLIKFPDDSTSLEQKETIEKIGFCLKRQEFENFINSYEHRSCQNTKTLNNHKIAKNSEIKRLELSEELEFSKLPDIPDNDGIFIIVTDNKKQETIIESKVYRGLSLLIDNENWEDFNNFPKKKTPKSKLSQLTLIILILLILFSLILLIKVVS